MCWEKKKVGASGGIGEYTGGEGGDATKQQGGQGGEENKHHQPIEENRRQRQLQKEHASSRKNVNINNVLLPSSKCVRQRWESKTLRDMVPVKKTPRRESGRQAKKYIYISHRLHIRQW